MKKQNIAALGSLIIIAASFLTGFLVSKNYSVKKPIQIQGDTSETDDPEIDFKPVAAMPDSPIDTADTADKITASTKMIYEYYYIGDGVVEKTEELSPYFLIDLTKENVQDLFSEWIVASFTPDEVVMRKYLDGSSNQYYIVGIHDGFIAVFYAAEIDGTTLKEITDTPVAALPMEEQARLKSGIHVLGQDALVKVLEDYSS